MGTPPVMTTLTYRLTDLPAEAGVVAEVRERLSHWLRVEVGVDEPRLCDIVLAVNEAVANVAEFAYRGGAGTFDLRADHDPGAARLTVAVCDRGRWRDTDPLVSSRNRGRGLPLMRTLADVVVVDTSAQGTCVRLRFDGVRAGGTVAAPR